MKNLNFRSATEKDAKTIVDIYREHSENQLGENNLIKIFSEYPSVIAELDSNIIGFAYCSRFAPDILELLNIYIVKKYRSMNFGTKLLENLENLVFKKYNAIILVNSSLYPGKKEKSSPKNFYIKNGYNVILSTKNSFVFGKEKKYEKN